ncbi:hypothetical protein NP233_g2969 [Leucocoprinus birnbaumii]|uniref:F-box domain-containing protein n=1 Tax=Leucocoprinus birnbaumii TaxID=56174 RepID=A0AAD5W3S5_9AGAR|nr:hypothetical protein NP233_g2969 [Leucocoprinus birnbaumii]
MQAASIFHLPNRDNEQLKSLNIKSFPNSTPQEETNAINYEVENIDEEISRLNLLKAHYRGRVNELRSKLSVLPIDILLRIFEHALSIEKDQLPGPDGILPLVLGCVCYSWRQLIWSTPSLWTTPSFSARLYSTPELIRLFFDNSGSLPVSVGWWDIVNYKPYEELGFIVRERPEKLRAFRCYFTNEGREIWNLAELKIQTIQMLSSGLLPNLREAKIYHDGEFHDEVLRLPSLRELHWKGFLKLPSYIPIDNLTTLFLEEIQPDYCLDVLLKAPKLETFHVTITSILLRAGISSPHDEGHLISTAFQNRREEVILPRLKYLKWVYDIHPLNRMWTYYLMKFVRLPSLEYLHFASRGSSTSLYVGEAEMELVRHQFLVSMPRLKHYRWFWGHIFNPQGLGYWDDSVQYPLGSTTRTFLSFLPSSVQKLHIDFLEKTAQDCLGFLFQLLKVGNSEGEIVLPALRELSIMGDSSRSVGERGLDLGVFYTELVEMLRSRRNGPPEKWKTIVRLEYFCIEVRDWGLLDKRWSKKGMNQCRDVAESIVGEGLRFEERGRVPQFDESEDEIYLAE